MTDLPNGWTASTLGALGQYLNGRGFKKSEWRESGRPIIRIQNLTGSGSAFNYYQGDVEDRYVARPGDLLVSWAATLGAYIWNGPEAVVNQHIFKVESKINPEFHRYLLHYKLNELMRHTHGSGMVHITRNRFDAVPVALPSSNEQQRIVEILDNHLSHLDAARNQLDGASRRLKMMQKSLLTSVLPEADAYPASWQRATVGQAGTVELGRQRHPDWHTGPNMRPYLRVANVFEDRLDLRDIKEMHWPAETFDRFRLKPGDVLLNEGQSPELLGRPALYWGDPPEIAFTNTLIRFQALKNVLPEFALLVFRRHMHAGRFAGEARITTNIAHLSVARLKPIEFPIPPLEEQHRLVQHLKEQLDNVTRLRRDISATQSRIEAVRRALFDAAFSGRLSRRSRGMDEMEGVAGV